MPRRSPAHVHGASKEQEHRTPLAAPKIPQTWGGAELDSQNPTPQTKHKTQAHCQSSPMETLTVLRGIEPLSQENPWRTFQCRDLSERNPSEEAPYRTLPNT